MIPQASLIRSKAETVVFFLLRLATIASRTICDLGTRRCRAATSKCAPSSSGILQVIVVMTVEYYRIAHWAIPKPSCVDANFVNVARLAPQKKHFMSCRGLYQSRIRNQSLCAFDSLRRQFEGPREDERDRKSNDDCEHD